MKRRGFFAAAFGLLVAPFAVLQERQRRKTIYIDKGVNFVLVGRRRRWKRWNATHTEVNREELIAKMKVAMEKM